MTTPNRCPWRLIAPITLTRARNRKLWRLVAAMTLAIGSAAPIAPKAEATQDLFYLLPMASANALGESPVFDFDALISGQLGDDLPRRAQASQTSGGTGHAASEASDNHFVATAVSGGFGGAVARAFIEFVVNDPQARGLVKVNLGAKLASAPDKNLKGVVSVGGPPNDFSSSDGFVAVRVAPGGAPFMITRADDGTIVALEWPLPPFGDYDLFEASARVQCMVDGCRWWKVVRLNQTVIEAGEGDGSFATLDLSPTFSVLPGVPFVIGIEAATSGNAAAVIDPVLEPHPDNPDILIDFPHAVPDLNPPPLMAGITPDALLALGIDPQPFIELGFMEESSPPPPPTGDTTAPTTLASATPRLKRWNKTPVTVLLNATDDAAGSGVREVHYALQGAETRSEVIPGDSAPVTISAEGTTTLSYFAVDNEGNQEAAKTLTVRIRPRRR